MARDGAYEQSWLDHLERRVAALYDEPIRPLLRTVVSRLEIGRERYGDDDFLDKDMVREALDETADVIAYMLLESEKRIAAGDPAGLTDLEQAAIHAAMADVYVRRAARRTPSI